MSAQTQRAMAAHTAAVDRLDNGVFACLDTPLASEILNRETFLERLYLEQKRADRSGSRFAVVFLEANTLLRVADEGALTRIVSVLCRCIRETDIKYADASGAGIIFCEIGAADGKSVMTALFARIAEAIAEALPIEQVGLVKLSFQVFPNRALCPVFARDPGPNIAALAVKRAIDIAGSVLGLILLSPVLFLIAAAVKLTSKGPIFFRQQRLRQYGRKFTFLKFRSMFAGSDESIHEKYMKSLILRNGNGRLRNEPTSSYKLANDRRVTRVGKFLRRTSLDELPQLLNVLMGDMSLVGPRPAISYEVECYDLWHKRRLAAKPGITGLWQVGGRSRLSFDEMVRLDLEYIASWSLALDCKILLKTPRAVVMGDGAK